MEIKKSHWVTDGNHMSMSMDFAKVDQEQRLVSGYATLDNVDSQDDRVLAEASKSAFSRFRGNIREMHQPIAAGRLVDFEEKEFYDPKDDEWYRGVYVTAYVSKGAQDTWEKVLDGTLTGFSIGGSILDSSSEFVKVGGKSKTVRIIKDFDLVELSLVDNPANQKANIFSITKNADGSVIKGMVAETTVEGIFLCPKDNTALTSTLEKVTCPNCDSGMQNIGWMEANSDKAEKVREVVTKFLNAETTKGGEDVTEPAPEETPEATPAAVPVGTPEPEERPQAAPEEAPEEEAQPAEVESEEDSVEKMIASLREDIKKHLDETKGSTDEAVQALTKRVEEINEVLKNETSEIVKKYDELSTRLAEVKNSNEDVTKRLDSIESASAIKKSATGEPVVEKKQTSKWGGAFSVDGLIG